MNEDEFSTSLARIRPELLGYLTRMVVRSEVAEELLQTASLRGFEVAGELEGSELRRWLFRVATNLAIDHLRRHGTWREGILLDARRDAEADPAFVEASTRLRGNPEMAAIAREHLLVCLGCTLRNLPAQSAAALLLVEVYGFGLEETAAMLGARFAQVKGWVQASRAALTARYEETCALVRKEGACFQCVELDGFFNGKQGNPLEGAGPAVTDARLRVARELSAVPAGPWHRMLSRFFADLGS